MYSLLYKRDYILWVMVFLATFYGVAITYISGCNKAQHKFLSITLIKI